MAAQYDHNDPFTREDDEVNPFSNPRDLRAVASTGLSSLPPEPPYFYGVCGARPADIPIDKAVLLKQKERELNAKELELIRREENPRDLRAVSSTGLSSLPPEPPSFYGVCGARPADIPIDKAVFLKQKERELNAKELELIRREEMVKRKEEAMAKAGVKVEEKNWPPFFPIIHQDIANEIPVYLQRVQYIAFATYLGVPLSLLWNLVAMTAQLIVGGDGRIFFLSIIYFLLGTPGAYFLWYRPLYRALKSESALRFGVFFFFYMVHIGFFVYAAIAPPLIFKGLYFTGAFTAIEQMTNNVVIGIMYFIGFGLFVIESVISIWVFQRVYRYFRGTGKAARVKRGTPA